MRFCGQFHSFEIAPPYDEDALNEAATRLCNCDKAITYRKQQQRKEAAQAAIIEKFGSGAAAEELEQPAETQALLCAVAQEAIAGRIVKASIKLRGDVKADFTITSKDI